MPADPRTLAAALAVVAVLGVSCGDGRPDGPGAVGPTAASPTPAAAPALPADQVGRAHRAALGLLALGALGAEKGSTSELRAFAARTASDGRSLDGQIRALATANGLVLGDDPGAATQGVLADLGTRSGRPFDQAWLTAVSDLIAQGREAAEAVGSAPTVSEEATSAARNVHARLDAMATALQRVIAKAGAGTTTR